jgi:hypothetical protein
MQLSKYFHFINQRMIKTKWLNFENPATGNAGSRSEALNEFSTISLVLTSEEKCKNGEERNSS